jgi:hypothetical protein
MFHTKKEVARRYSVTDRTVDNWVALGILDPPIKFGPAQQSRVRFTTEAVEAIADRLAKRAGHAR